MKLTKLLFACLMMTVIGFTSCSKEDDDPYANLSGTYTLGAVVVDGVTTTGSGILNLNATTKEGSLAIVYRIDVTDFTLEGEFIYTATSDLLTLNPGTSTEQKWTRLTNTSKEQKIKFTQAVSGKSRSVELTFKK